MQSISRTSTAIIPVMCSLLNVEPLHNDNGHLIAPYSQNNLSTVGFKKRAIKKTDELLTVCYSLLSPGWLLGRDVVGDIR